MTDPTVQQPEPQAPQTQPPAYQPPSYDQAAYEPLTRPQEPQAYANPSQPSQGAYGAPTGVYGPPGGSYSPVMTQEKTDSLAIASVSVSGAAVLGSLLALAGIGLGMLVFFLAPIVGAVLGHISLRNIKRDGTKGRGLALTGIIAGWATLLVQLLAFGAVVAFFLIALFFGFSA